MMHEKAAAGPDARNSIPVPGTGKGISGKTSCLSGGQRPFFHMPLLTLYQRTVAGM
jgi:hypothetical protein